MPPITIAGRAWHLFLQLLCIFKRPPTLHMTEDAKRQLVFHMSRITEFRPAASVLWGSNVVDGVTRPPQWGVAFYDISSRPFGRVVQIGGVPFVFTQQRAYTHLDGATLDYRGGRFVVSESAHA